MSFRQGGGSGGPGGPGLWVGDPWTLAAPWWPVPLVPLPSIALSLCPILPRPCRGCKSPVSQRVPGPSLLRVGAQKHVGNACRPRGGPPQMTGPRPLASPPSSCICNSRPWIQSFQAAPPRAPGASHRPLGLRDRERGRGPGNPGERQTCIGHAAPSPLPLPGGALGGPACTPHHTGVRSLRPGAPGSPGRASGQPWAGRGGSGGKPAPGICFPLK